MSRDPSLFDPFVIEPIRQKNKALENDPMSLKTSLVSTETNFTGRQKTNASWETATKAVQTLPVSTWKMSKAIQLTRIDVPSQTVLLMFLC